jgi:hypothetical protein
MADEEKLAQGEEKVEELPAEAVSGEEADKVTGQAIGSTLNTNLTKDGFGNLTFRAPLTNNLGG